MRPDAEWYLDNVLAYGVPGRVMPVPRGPAARWRGWWDAQWQALDGEAAARIAREQGFVIATEQLWRCGWQQHDLRREIRRGCWSAPARGVASPVVVPPSDARFLDERRSHALAAAAAWLLRPGQVISARSAAILFGLPTLFVPRAPELTAAAPTTLGRHGSAHLYSAGLTGRDVTSWFGAAVTTPARTVIDAARHDARDGVMTADAALREGLVTAEELHSCLDTARGWVGVRRAREVVALASPLAESPLESVVRLALHDAGFSIPELQVEFDDPRWACTHRVDLLLRRERLIIEADGRGKYTDDELWREKRREGRIRALSGLRVERVVWADLTPANWPETERRLREASSSPGQPNSAPNSD